MSYPRDSRIDDGAWIYEYAMAIPDNIHAEFLMSVTLLKHLHPKMNDIVRAIEEAGHTEGNLAGRCQSKYTSHFPSSLVMRDFDHTALKYTDVGEVAIEVMLKIDELPPPWFWGLGRALDIPHDLPFNPRDAKDDATKERERHFREMLEPDV